MKYIYTLLLACNGLYASITIPTTQISRSILVSSSSIDTTGNFSVTARVHGSGILGPLFSVGGYGANVLTGGSGKILFFYVADTNSPGVGNCDVDINNGTDITIRLVRNLTANSLYPNGYVVGTVWNTTTAQLLHSCYFTINTKATGSSIVSNNITIGGAAASGTLDYLRWDTSSPVVSTVPQAFINSPTSFLDFEFTNASVNADTSSYSQDLTGQSFVTYPAGLNPACNTGTPQSVPINTIMIVSAANCYSLNGNYQLTYSWSYAGAGADGVTQTPTYTTPTSQNTNITGLTKFGSINSQLIVTDSSSNSSTYTFHNGVVITTNSSGAIDLAAEGLTNTQQFIIGPQVTLGKSNWPFADTSIDNERQLINDYLYLTSGYTPYWRTLASGTVTLTAGTGNVVGVGTSFKSQFCGGGTSWDNVHRLIWKYTALDGQTHYGQSGIASCTDDTHMTINLSYPTSPYYPWPNCSSGCTYSYSVMDTSSTAYYLWQGAAWGAPNNYYDNVEFFLVNYWRSGIDLYYSGAKTMATYWLEFPDLDYFYNTWFATDNYNPGGTAWCSPEPRTYAITGMILWYQTIGSPSYLYDVSNLNPSALENLSNVYNFALQSRLPAWDGLDDLRNDAYTLSGASLMALIETGTVKTGHQSIIKNSLSSIWTPYRRTGSFIGWNSFYYGGSSITILNGSGSVNVTNNSNQIVGVGTGFSAGNIGNTIWTFPAPANTAPTYCNSCSSTGNVIGGDAQMYVVTGVSGQTLTISPNYSGVTATGQGFITGQNGLAGWGLQPFMEGLLGEAFFHAAQAMFNYDTPSQTLFNNYGHDAANLVQSMIPSDNGGLYNGEYFAGCFPPMYNTATNGQQFCYGLHNGYPGTATPGDSRTIATEVMRVLTYDYQVKGTNLTTANTLMNQMFNRPPSGDGYYIDAYDLQGCVAGICNEYGFYVGYLIPGNSSYYQFPAKWAGEASGFTEGASTLAGIVAQSPPTPNLTSIIGTFTGTIQ